MVRAVVPVIGLLFSLWASADNVDWETYYPENFQATRQNARDQSLRNSIFEILNGVHARHQGSHDTLVSHCTTNTCYQQSPVGYNGARRALFGQLHLTEVDGNYFIHCAYCDTDLGSSDFSRGKGPGPNKIPDSNVMNAEHTWPQSHFTRAFSTDMQKSDLHHLFPVRSSANSLRGNVPFGEVITVKKQSCPASELGYTSWGDKEDHFEPPTNHRGNVARAIFYFAVRYKMSIDPQEEQYLKRWNQDDPVDQSEQDRNDSIFKIQKNRNPFIDYPNLIDQIADF